MRSLVCLTLRHKRGQALGHCETLGLRSGEFRAKPLPTYLHALNERLKALQNTQ